MKQSSKPYGIAKPHICVSMASTFPQDPYLPLKYLRFSAHERWSNGRIKRCGHGETILEAWADLQKEKSKQEKWLTQHPQFMDLFEPPILPTIASN